MKRRAFLAAACVLAAMSRGHAQSVRRPPRIGTLNFGAPPAPGGSADPIERHLRMLGYAAPGQVVFVRRYASGDRSHFPRLAAELLRADLDLIFTPGSDVARTFARTDVRVPVVFVVSDDPVATGLVRSLGRPAGRFTGISLMSPELGPKRLELLVEALPRARKVAVLYDENHAKYLTEMRAPAASMGITLLPIRFDTVADFEPAFASAKQGGAAAMFVAPNRFTLAYAARLAALSIEHGIPAISAYDSFAAAGGLLSYGPVVDDAVARAASIIDRILRGADPADLPVEQPPRIALTLNRKAARALAIELPASMLLRADRVIE